MAIARINYYQAPRYRVGGKVMDVKGEFIKSEKLTLSGSSVSTSFDIPQDAGLFSIHVDSEFVVSIGASPTASDDDTSERLMGSYVHFFEWNNVSQVNTRIALLNV